MYSDISEWDLFLYCGWKENGHWNSLCLLVSNLIYDKHSDQFWLKASGWDNWYFCR